MVFHASKFFCYPPINNPVFLAYGVPLYIGIPTSIIFYCYLKIFKTVRSHNNNFHLPGNQATMANVEEIKVGPVEGLTSFNKDNSAKLSGESIVQ